LMRLQRSFLCYRPPQDAPPAASLPARAAGYVTFGSFNTLAKATADTVRVWSRILRAAPGSRLYLKARGLRDPHMQEKFASLFAQFGIEPGRLTMMPLVISQREHLGLYDRMDVALDSFPYNGTTTICEALWMGVPVVTLRGTRHAGRVGTAIMTALGLDEFAAADEDAYVACAAALASDLDRLERLRIGMRERMSKSQLCDEFAFARAMERAYRQAWQAWCERRD